MFSRHVEFLLYRVLYFARNIIQMFLSIEHYLEYILYILSITLHSNSYFWPNLNIHIILLLITKIFDLVSTVLTRCSHFTRFTRYLPRSFSADRQSFSTRKIGTREGDRKKFEKWNTAMSVLDG